MLALASLALWLPVLALAARPASPQQPRTLQKKSRAAKRNNGGFTWGTDPVRGVNVRLAGMSVRCKRLLSGLCSWVDGSSPRCVDLVAAWRLSAARLDRGRATEP
jgi:hypothetical protein